MRIVYFIILFTFVCNCAKNQGLANSIKNSDVANDLTVTTAGKVLDARQGKVLNEKVDELTGGYILQSMHRVRVSSNATTTTFGDLINSLYNDTASYLNTLTDNDYYQIASVRVPGSDIKFVTPEISTHDKLFELEQNIYMMIKISNTVFMYYIEVRGGNASRMFTHNNNGTFTEITNNIIGQERSIEYNINLYHHN
jgi:hypothetical protein